MLIHAVWQQYVVLVQVNTDGEDNTRAKDTNRIETH